MKCDHNHNGLEVLATADEAEQVSVLLSYASEYFDRPMPDIHDQLVINGLDGNYELTIWCVDETNTNPYTRMLREGMQEDRLSADEIAILREEGMLKPLYRQKICTMGTVKADLCFTNNALVLVELTKTEE